MMMLSALALVLSTARAAPASLTFAHSYGSHMVRAHTAQQATYLMASTCLWLQLNRPHAAASQVLQQEPKQAVVWGRCSPIKCASVKVSLSAAGDIPRTVAAQSGGVAGTWIAKLPATAGGDTPHKLTATDGADTVALDDILFGDVWVCSG